MNKQKRKPILTAILAISIIISITTGVTLLAAGITEFPLTTNSGALVADEETKYITAFEQNPETKLITATVQIHNSISAAEEIEIQAITIQHRR